MGTLMTPQQWKSLRLYLFYWIGYLFIFTVIEGLTDHDFLIVFRNELVSLPPKVAFVGIVVEYLMKDLFSKRYAQFLGKYILLLLGFAILLRAIDNYVILKYFLIYWEKEPLLGSAPLLYNLIKLQFLLAVPFCITLFRRISILARVEEKAVREEKAFIKLKCERRVVKVFYNDICYFEAQGNYLVTHTVNGSHRSHLSISELEGILPDTVFTRIHRSFIVSLDKVQSYTSSLVVIGDKKIPIGRSYLAKARNSL
jgi:hypothetical protein